MQIKDVQRGLRDVVGFERDVNFNLAESLTRDISGLTVQGQHPLLNLSMLRKIAPVDLAITSTEWEENRLYNIDDMVVYNGVQYRFLGRNQGAFNEDFNDSFDITLPPDQQPAYWEEMDAFSKWLFDFRDRSISQVVSRFLVEKLNNGKSKTLLEDKYLFETTGRMSDTIINTGSFVGFQIKCPRYKGVSVKIKKVGLQMKGTGRVRMYLYHSSQTTPLKEVAFTRHKNGSMEWFSTDELRLNYVGANHDAGGVYYLVYDQNDIGEQVAINKVYDWSKAPCGTCNRIDYNNYMAWSKMVEIVPFKVPTTEKGELWDVADVVPTMSQNYGLNLQISVECDTTDIVLEHKMAFANVIAKQFAVDLLTTLYYNPATRVNIDVQNGNFNTIYADLNGDQMKSKTGMRYELEQAYKAVSIDLGGMDKICLPCTKRGVKVRAI